LNRQSLIRILALALLLVLGTGMPASAAGLLNWLTGGGEEAVEASAMPTLPPAELLMGGTPRAEASGTPEATAEPTPEATLAPIPDAAIEDDGLLRVELRSLGAPTQLHLTLAGIYAVDADPGFRFDRDARVTLSAANGSVYLAVGGLTIDMGASLTLTRHADGEEGGGGLTIDESERDTLYCGDLTVSCAEGNGLRAILRIQVEDYLYGVVAYEMSDSFPIEALKAQAVAARTYAMQRKWQSGGRDYDVADTTADQVFKGFDEGYSNVIQAVDVTRGVVGLYDGGFAICYYTASNGGQTALPSQVLGREGSDGYLAMADDPYDLENPSSLQNELTVTSRCEGSPALKAMLEEALGKQLREKGYADGEWALDTIASIEPVNPRFEGSRMYDGLAFSLRARLLKPVETPTPSPAASDVPADAAADADATEDAQASPEPLDFFLEADGNAPPEVHETPAPTESAEPQASNAPSPAATQRPETVDALAAALMGEAAPTPQPTKVPREWVTSEELYTVTLDVYDQVKDQLSLGLNGADYELISVRTQTDGDGVPQSFTLVMRRFGHGAGMSQRGAQWMAGHYDMSWRQILAFYYPGMSLERMRWPEAPLTALEALPASVGAARPRPTPTPTPAPLPALKAGEYYAVVTATALNVRQQPTTAARALDQLAKGRRVIVSGESDAEGWVRIHTAELEGYVKAEYLEREE